MPPSIRYAPNVAPSFQLQQASQAFLVLPVLQESQVRQALLQLPEFLVHQVYRQRLEFLAASKLSYSMYKTSDKTKIVQPKPEL